MATIRIPARDGSGTFSGYLAETAGADAGIVVVQEILGVNPGIRAMVHDWAGLGYTAVAPDLFWRLQPDVNLDADDPEQFKQALELMYRFSLDQGVADIEAAIQALRAKGCRKVGVVGFCFGGLLAYLAATRTDSDATVSYYGVNIDKFLHEQHAIGKPLLLQVALRDHFVTAEARQTIDDGLAGNSHVTIHGYDADHAFARAVGNSRVPELAEQADARTQAFFKEHLA
ncbi:dienelactone hydrolase family protein [Glacieibacterium sp.]|uniref:dienelactone hydrolase family protein n=1 Tax=Glacieibacterium sp. TaxID=2860237 RepID=UPI003B001825